jgi:trehalose 6-phosphate synthase/phosphatase
MAVVIVSNRLPVSVKKKNGRLVLSRSLGGLATGLASYVTPRQDNIWIGWPGIASEELTDNDKQILATRLARRGYVPVFLTRKQISEFYDGYSNRLLWPLLHNLPRGKVDDATARRWWQAYRSVNRKYAEVVASLADPGNRIWVHDYLLMLLPSFLKQERSDVNVGFFLHVPFPAPEQYMELRQAKQLVEGVLSADLIGFHTLPYADNFKKVVEQTGLGRIDGDKIVRESSVIRVGEFPMGIDYVKFAGASRSRGVRKEVKRLKRKYKGLKVIASVDRLDISKGLVERLIAYREFLRLNPERIGKVVLVMVAAPSRNNLPAHKRLSSKLLALSRQINREYGSDSWKPVDYINETLPFEAVSALFKIADVAFIVPLKDGMNLAAKEFVASSGRRGVLILSQTAGAAEELHDALIVDPTRPETLVMALTQAVSMKRRELRLRLKRMRQYLSVNTVNNWAATFIDTLSRPVPGTPRLTRALNKGIEKELLSNYVSAKRRLLLLDYDGSLVPFKENYAEATPPKSLISLLDKLCANSHNDVVMVSGRQELELDKWFGNLDIGLVAEHGAAIKPLNRSWHVVEGHDTHWKELVMPILNRYVVKAPGAKVEVKPHSLVWHYRGVNPYHAQKYAVTIKHALRPILEQQGLQMLQGNKNIEIKNPKATKGSAVQRWLSNRYDFIMALGDDATDEELFAALPPNVYSIKVGRGLTHAHYRLPSYREVLLLLKAMSSR